MQLDIVIPCFDEEEVLGVRTPESEVFWEK